MNKTKTVSLMVELSVTVPAEWEEDEINSITFMIPTGDIVVFSDGNPLPGSEVTSYCTQEYYADPE